MVTGTRKAPVVIALLAILAWGSGAPSDRGAGSVAAADQAAGSEPPTLEELRNATYEGLEAPGGACSLVDGIWEGEPYVEHGSSRARVIFAGDLRLLGDLDGDGADEAVVVLAESTGGSGVVSYLAAVARGDDGGVDNIATVALGDRVQIRQARIQGGRVVVDAVRAGPEDAACCPGELVRWGWTLTDTGFEQVVSETTGRLSLEALAGSEWVLRRFDLDEPAPAEPEVTLRYQDGRLDGTSGCNRYAAPVTPGDMPGDISVGVTMGTRMACPEPAASVEDRFLAQFGDVSTFGFMLGELALTYRTDDHIGVMLLEPRSRSDGPS
jgi:heat shock protein HslJ